MTINLSKPQRPKVYAILSHPVDGKGEEILTLMPGFSYEDVRTKVIKNFQQEVKINPDTYNIGVQVAYAFLDELVPIDLIVKALDQLAKRDTPIPAIKPIEKSVNEMESYVRYVFDKAQSTDKEKTVAETVLSKFRELIIKEKSHA